MKKRSSWQHTLLKHLAFAFVPAVLWVGAISLRPLVLDPFCVKAGGICTKESVFFIDQLSIGMEDWKADAYSYWTQNLSGIIALIVPFLWNFSGFLRSQAKRPIHSSLATTSLISGLDFLLVLQVMSWNGLFTEISHLLSHRPRPFVYLDPFTRGTDPAHYTSFYSGHTSFSAASTFILLLILIRRKAPFPILLASAASYQILVFSTGYFRVLAGRHFLTDVIVGAIAGSLTAGAVYLFSKRPSMASPLLNPIQGLSKNARSNWK